LRPVLALPPYLLGDRIGRRRVADAVEQREEERIAAAALVARPSVLDGAERRAGAEVAVHRRPVLPARAVERAGVIRAVARAHDRDGVAQALHARGVLNERLPAHPRGL